MNLGSQNYDYDKTMKLVADIVIIMTIIEANLMDTSFSNKMWGRGKLYGCSVILCSGYRTR